METICTTRLDTDYFLLSLDEIPQVGTDELSGQDFWRTDRQTEGRTGRQAEKKTDRQRMKNTI